MIKDIQVWGTVMEGRVLPAGGGNKRASRDEPAYRQEFAFAGAALQHALSVAQCDTADTSVQLARMQRRRSIAHMTMDSSVNE